MDGLEIIRNLSSLLEEGHDPNELAEKLYYRTNIIGKKIQLGYGQGVREYEVVGVIQSPKAGIETLIGQKFPAMVYIPYQTVNDIYGENKVSIAYACAL